MSDGGPSPADFAAAAREDVRHGSACSIGCGLIVIGGALAAAGLFRPVGEVSAAVGAVVVAVILGGVFVSAARIARVMGELLPRPGDALAALIRATPDAAGWLVLRVHSQPGGGTRWLALTFTHGRGAQADARWLPGTRADRAPGGRRVSALPPDQAQLLAHRLRVVLGPPAAAPGPVTVRDGAPYDVATCWAGGDPHHVSGNLSGPRPPEGDLWAELVEAGLALVDEARAS